MSSPTHTGGSPPEPAGSHRRSREHARIRAAYQHYNSSETEQRKRDRTNDGTRLNMQTRWQAISRTLRSLHLPEGFQALDVGCGTGEDLRRIATEFAHFRPSLHGIDLLANRIEQARAAVPDAILHVGGAEQLPYPSGSFDVVLVATVFSSILDDEATREVTSEIIRVLSDNGTVVCYDMRYPNPWNPHTRALGAGELQRLFPEAGIRLHPVTLVPPLARRLGGLAGPVYGPLHAVHLLRSHYVAEISPARRLHVADAPRTGYQGRTDHQQDLPQPGDEREPKQSGQRIHDAGPTAPPAAPTRPPRLAFQTFLTLGGLGCERALTFAAVTLILRVLPSSEGGAFVLMLKITGVMVALSNLGLPTSAIRLISGALGEGRDTWAAALLRAFLLTRLGMAAALTALGFLAGGWAARYVFGNPTATSFVEWGCVSAGANAILGFSLYHLQARQSFGRYTALNVISSVARTSAIVLLFAVGSLSAYKAASAWALLPLGAAVTGLFFAPRNFMGRLDHGEVRRAWAELIRLGKWLWVSATVATIFNNADSLLVVRYLGFADAGLYGAAINLSLIVALLASASSIVLLPTVSRLAGLPQLRGFFWRSLLLSSVTAMLLLPGAAVGPWIMGTVYGPRFLPAVPAFRWLFVGALLTIVSATVSVVFLALHKPGHVVGQALSQIAVAMPCYLMLIPREGILGGAIGTFAGQATSLLYVLCVAPALLRGRESTAPDRPRQGPIAP